VQAVLRVVPGLKADYGIETPRAQRPKTVGPGKARQEIVMFGSLGNLAGILKQAGQMRQQMLKQQEELARQMFEGQAGGGLVRAVVTGRFEIREIKIDPQAVNDVELLEDLVKAAIGAAMTKAQEAAGKIMSDFAGSLNIPGLQEMLGGSSPS
jgi:nucleoid-associated protein EbfC